MYAKIKNGALLFAETQAEGYKPYTQVLPPSPYHTFGGIEEGEDTITELWLEPELEVLRNQLLLAADVVKDAALASSCTLEVEDVGAVVWDTQAAANVTALVAKLPYRAEGWQTGFILADDSSIMINADSLVAISDAMEAYAVAIYATKTAALAAIEAAESSEALLALAVERGLA